MLRRFAPIVFAIVMMVQLVAPQRMHAQTETQPVIITDGAAFWTLGVPQWGYVGDKISTRVRVLNGTPESKLTFAVKIVYSGDAGMNFFGNDGGNGYFERCEEGNYCIIWYVDVLPEGERAQDLYLDITLSKEGRGQVGIYPFVNFNTPGQPEVPFDQVVHQYDIQVIRHP